MVSRTMSFILSLSHSQVSNSGPGGYPDPSSSLLAPYVCFSLSPLLTDTGNCAACENKLAQTCDTEGNDATW